MDDTELIQQLQYIGVLSSTLVCSSYAQGRLDANPEVAELYFNRTSFLSEPCSHSMRIYCIKHGIIINPVCCICNNAVKFNTTLGFSSHCSTKCSNSSQLKKDTIQQTNLYKFGGHPRSTLDVQRKYFETCFKKYGTIWPIQNKQIQSKKNDTTMSRYGSKTYQTSDVGRQRLIATNLERYGVEFPFQNIQIRQKAAETVIAKYGVVSTSQLPEVSLRQQQSKYRSLFDDTMYEKLNSSSWLLHEHHVLQKSLTQIALELGLKDEKSISTKCKQFGIPIIIYNSGISIGEKQVLEFICNHIDSTQVLQNCRDIIPPKELDIFIPSLNIAIEYCGLYWHSSKFRTVSYHLDKLNDCKERGIRLITIFEDEWVYNQTIVKQKLLNILQLTNNDTIFARKCSVVDVNNSDKLKFFNDNHIQGSGPGSITYGLKYEGSYVAMVTFINRGHGEYVLNRYATSCNVPGGFTKLLSHFTHNIIWNRIVTFADLRWSSGELYIKSGFTVEAQLPPDYQYINGQHRIHKFNFRHKNLSNILGDQYNERLSELKNTENANIQRIYNCGLLKFSILNPGIIS